MRGLVLSVLLLAASAAAMLPDRDDMARIKRIMASPLLQRIADQLGLQIPDLPDPETMKNQVFANIDNVDINALAANASQTGCLPEGVSFPDNTREAVRNCVANVYGALRRSPMAVLRGCPSGAELSRPTTTTPRPRRRFGFRRFGRSLRDNLMARAMNCAKQMLQECVASNLSLTTDSQVNETSFNALVDSMTAPEEYKTRQKEILQICLSATPSTLSGENSIKFQLRCIGDMCGIDCALGVADNVSPTVGLVARSGGSVCFAGLEPTPQSALAQATCVSEAVSAFFRNRLTETSVSAGRRRRDVEDQLWKMLGGLQGLERVLGVAPTPRPCRPFWGRRCPPTPPPSPRITEEEVNATIARVEEFVGPIGGLFSSIPDRLASVADCYYTAIGALSIDGSVNVAAVRSVMAEFGGDAGILSAASQVIDYCDNAGLITSAGEFHTCLLSGASYACRLIELIEEQPAMG